MLKHFRHHSFTSLDRYHKCPLCYRFSYIDKKKAGRIDITGTRPGLVAHKLVEMFFSHRNETGEIRWEIFSERFEEVYDSYMNSGGIYLGPDAFASSKEEAHTSIFSWTENLVSLLKQQNLALPFTISEARFGSGRTGLQISDNIFLTGGPDLFASESQDSPGRLVDFKASDSTYHLNFKQLYLYAITLKKHFKVTVAMVGYLLFKSPQAKWSAFTKEREDETIFWAEEIVKAISNEKFDPTPSEQACRFCDYRFECQFATTVKKEKVITTFSSIKKKQSVGDIVSNGPNLPEL